MILAEEMILGKTTRILDGKIVKCFTDYKVNLIKANAWIGRRSISHTLISDFWILYIYLGVWA